MFDQLKNFQEGIVKAMALKLKVITPVTHAFYALLSIFE